MSIERNWAIVKLDRTADWTDPNIPTRGESHIIESYLADLSSQTFCCEITPSFALHLLHYEWDGEPDDNAQNEAVQDYLDEAQVQAEPVVYVHCHGVLAMPRIKEGECKPGLIELGLDGTEDIVDDEAALEGMLEYYQGNWV